ncbi:MAG: TRIC cation channel family protein [Acidobacteria bacterium]|nr:TRIC cation channel family protein [Acidobacteriota bacterium]
MTGIGGGVLRDILVNEIPTVLRAELYAIVALAGALVVVAGDVFHFPPAATTVAGAVLCFSIRMIAIRRGWHLPTAT